MALRNYKPKHAKANWLSVPGAVPVTSAHEQRQAAKKYKPVKINFPITPEMNRTLRKLHAAQPPFVLIRRSTPQRARELAAYRREAHEFVKAAIKRGETCPVVAAIKELREGKLYGQKISARLNEVHHTRGRVGRLLRDQRFFMAISKEGHRFVHAHPEEARAHGWLAGAGEWNTVTK